MVLQENILNIIKNILKEKIKPYTIYIFGSSVNGNFNDESDVDIAFLSSTEISGYDIFMIAQEIADLIKREIDLIDLNKASTVFRAQVVGTGTIIYCNNDYDRMNFEMRALKEYALLNEERAVILDSIKERGKVYGD